MHTSDLKQMDDAVDRDRLVDTAIRLVGVASPTGSGGAVADCLAGILREDGFEVSRPAGGHEAAPAVIARLETGKPGRTLIFNGHLDTVHLPFVPPTVAGDLIRGSGASDMKAGVAAAVEALRVLRHTGALTGGRVILVAHDLHEAPWGLGEQLHQLIRDGLSGDAVLIPESLSGYLPVRGRGCATWKVTLRREGAPVHEVMRPVDEPDVLRAGVELACRLHELSDRLAAKVDPVAGAESVFIGQIHGGEIYNQYPKECWLEGTRRWLPETDASLVEPEFRALVDEVASAMKVAAAIDYRFVRGAFHLDTQHPVVTAFQRAHAGLTGQPLMEGAKPFVDDGNSFWSMAGIPAITHGPRAAGQHTLDEWVSIEDLVRVARVYARTAVEFCGGN